MVKSHAATGAREERLNEECQDQVYRGRCKGDRKENKADGNWEGSLGTREGYSDGSCNQENSGKFCVPTVHAGGRWKMKLKRKPMKERSF